MFIGQNFDYNEFVKITDNIKRKDINESEKYFLQYSIKGGKGRSRLLNYLANNCSKKLPEWLKKNQSILKPFEIVELISGYKKNEECHNLSEIIINMYSVSDSSVQLAIRRNLILKANYNEVKYILSNYIKDSYFLPIYARFKTNETDSLVKNALNKIPYLEKKKAEKADVGLPLDWGLEKTNK